MSFYPQDIIVTIPSDQSSANNSSGTAYSASTSEGGELMNVPDWLTVKWNPPSGGATGYNWVFSASSLAPAPTSVAISKKNTDGSKDELKVWVNPTTNTLQQGTSNNITSPVNPLVPVGNTVTFQSSLTNPSWSVVESQGGVAHTKINVTATGATGAFTVPSNESDANLQRAYVGSSKSSPLALAYYGAGAYVIITDGGSYSRIWFAPQGLDAGMSSNILNYSQNLVMYFSFQLITPSLTTPGVVCYGLVDQNSVPPQFVEKMFNASTPLATLYVAPPPPILQGSKTQQYLTCFLLNVPQLNQTTS
jgi:hypothetical protein